MMSKLLMLLAVAQVFLSLLIDFTIVRSYLFLSGCALVAFSTLALLLLGQGRRLMLMIAGRVTADPSALDELKSLNEQLTRSSFDLRTPLLKKRKQDRARRWRRSVVLFLQTLLCLGLTLIAASLVTRGS